MTRFLSNTKLYTFEAEDGERFTFAAYTTDGAFNIAKRLFRNKSFILEEKRDVLPRRADGPLS